MTSPAAVVDGQYGMSFASWIASGWLAGIIPAALVAWLIGRKSGFATWTIWITVGYCLALFLLIAIVNGGRTSVPPATFLLSMFINSLAIPPFMIRGYLTDLGAWIWGLLALLPFIVTLALTYLVTNQRAHRRAEDRG